LVHIGKTLSPHGLKGHLKIKLFLDAEKLLFEGQEIEIYSNSSNSYKSYIVEELTFGNKLITKIKNYENRESLKYLRNSNIFISKKNFPTRVDGENYLFDYFGCKVIDQLENDLGIVKEILDIPGNYVFVIEKKNKEYLAPVSGDVIQFFDFENSILKVNKIEGLFD